MLASRVAGRMQLTEEARSLVAAFAASVRVRPAAGAPPPPQRPPADQPALRVWATSATDSIAAGPDAAAFPQATGEGQEGGVRLAAARGETTAFQVLRRAAPGRPDEPAAHDAPPPVLGVGHRTPHSKPPEPVVWGFQSPEAFMLRSKPMSPPLLSCACTPQVGVRRVVDLGGATFRADCTDLAAVERSAGAIDRASCISLRRLAPPDALVPCRWGVSSQQLSRHWLNQ